MKRANLTYLMQLLFGAVTLCCSKEITIFPSSGTIIIIPSTSNVLMTDLTLICGLEPETLIPGVNYTTQWILPGEEMINSTTGRFDFIEDHVVISDTLIVPGTTLTVTNLSFIDAGTYTCEGRGTDPGASLVWAATSFEVQLNLELLSNSSTVNAAVNDSAATLYCEMRAFIRPDSFLIWEGPGGHRITSGTEKFEITFSDGSPNTAANGRNLLIRSRISTLTIINLGLSDAGTYTCTLMDTNQTKVMIDLQVTRGSNKTLTEITENSSNHTHQMTIIILCSLIAILILIGLLIIAGAEVCCHMHALKRRKCNSHTRARSMYYNVIALLGLKHRVRHYNNQHDESTTTRQDNDSIAYNVTEDDLNVDFVNRSVYQDNLNTVEMNVDHDEIAVSNSCCGLTVDGVSDSEINMASFDADSTMQENEAYGAAIDGIDIDTKENIAYDKVSLLDDSANDPTVDCSISGDEINSSVDCVGADILMEENETYGVATDGISVDIMKGNIAYGALTFQDDSTRDIIVDCDKNDVSDGVHTLEINEDHGVTDTITEENEAYGVATDGIVIDNLDRNVAYGVIFQDESAGDAVIDYDKNDGPVTEDGVRTSNQMNVEHGVTDIVKENDADVVARDSKDIETRNVAYGAVIIFQNESAGDVMVDYGKNDGEVSDSEVNIAYGVADSIVQETDSSVATDVKGMKRNLAYGAVLFQDESAGDAMMDRGCDNDLEKNVAYSMIDTFMEENEAYGVATDGIGVDIMKRNTAYGAITFQDDSTGVAMDLEKGSMDGGTQ